MTKRRALGKGLSSLIPELPPHPLPAPEAQGVGLKLIDPGSVVPNRFQPREIFDESELELLADSIRRDGLLQPILVRPLDGGYEIVAGERRWRAGVRAGLKRIPALVQEVSDDRALELALVENLQRRDLDPIEEARAYRHLSERFGLTQEQIAERTGKSRPAIANALRTLKLPSDIQDLLRSGEITRGHARALLALEDEAAIRKLAERLRSESLSVRTAEAASRTSKGEKPVAADTVDPNVRAAQDRLQSRLGTQVRIHVGPKGKGTIEIAFESDEELSRLFDGLMTARF
jgi:ParB family chromosome partitioning protein